MKRTNRTSIAPTQERITITIEELTELLGCGIISARKLAEESGAKFHVGRRVLINKRKFEDYIDTLN